MCIFDDILETKDLDKIKVGFEKVIYYIYELSKLIKENKFQVFYSFITIHRHPYQFLYGLIK